LIAIRFFTELYYGRRSRILNKTLQNKESDNEKFSDVFGRTFCNPLGEKSNVKMGKAGGGGRFGVERQKRTAKMVRFGVTFLQISFRAFAPYGSASP
jgi:hypothetical protein